MANQTAEEIIEAQNALINFDPSTGQVTHTADHREINMMVLEYVNSMLAFEANVTTVTVEGESKKGIKSSKLEKRLVGAIIFLGQAYGEDFFIKQFASDTLTFRNGLEPQSGNKITILFAQDPTIAAAIILHNSAKT